MKMTMLIIATVIKTNISKISRSSSSLVVGGVRGVKPFKCCLSLYSYHNLTLTSFLDADADADADADQVE